MRSAIAIITYRRLHALREELKGIEQHCSHYPLGIFEDCGQRDATSTFLSERHKRKPVYRPHLLADEWVLTDEARQGMLTEEEKLIGSDHAWPRHFLGTRNLGVAGNSNRAIKWFMDETDADHLCLLNDDLHVLGDFVTYYRIAHKDLGVGLFCFLPTGGVYDHESYKPVMLRSRGYSIRLMPRFTGIMLSITRELLKKIGYFDAAFKFFGEEHSDFTIRARFAGGIQLDGQMLNCLDLDTAIPVLKHQDVETSVIGADRKRADQEASLAMRRASDGYRSRHYYRPFTLKLPFTVGTFGNNPGIPFEFLHNHVLIEPGVVKS